MLNSILPGNGILKKELLFNKFMYLPPIGTDLQYVSKLKKLNFYDTRKADVNYL